MKKFKISVVMAIYNVEKYLAEAIDSIINQTISFEDNIEIILVNDGSPDDCEKICLDYKNMYPKNIKYIKKENGGVSSARNAGLEIASGEIINFLDSDDYFSNNAFEEVLNFFDKNDKKTDVVALNLVNFEMSCGSWVNKEYFINTQLIDMNAECNFMQCQVGASFIKNESAKKYVFDSKIKIHEDSHYLYRIFRDKPFCGTISNATYWHRIRKTGSSATQNIKHKHNIFSISNNVFIDLINFYKDKSSIIPKFLQTFIILEYNYYVLEKINECKFTGSEKRELLNSIKTIFDSLDNNNIQNHFVLNYEHKSRMLSIKKDFNNLYNYYPKLSSSSKYYVHYIGTRFKNFTKKSILYIPRRIKRRTFRGTNEKIADINYDLNIATKNINNIFDWERYYEIKINELINKNKMIDDAISEIKKNYEITNNEIKKQINEFMIPEKAKSKNLIMYFHSGSRNHGCEAIIRSTMKILKANKESTYLSSYRKNEDFLYGINDCISCIKEPTIYDENLPRFHMGDCSFNLKDCGLENDKKFFSDNAVALSIGGDNYCYGEITNNLLRCYNMFFHKNKIKTVLHCCSLNEDVFEDKKNIDDLKMYDLILPRESLTYDLLIKNNITKNTHLTIDPAFLLTSKETILPNNFIINNTICINISPYVIDKKNDLMMLNIYSLIEYIINKTNYNIALIPNVCWEKISDIPILTELYNKYCYSNRLCLFEEKSAEELKYIISKSHMLIASRTHSSIAAYSSCIPTIVIGYSIKSLGIAKDIFGDTKKYVIAKEDFKNTDDLINMFNNIELNYEKEKELLSEVIPVYKKKALIIEHEINKLYSKKPLPYYLCSGCSACLSICPSNAIKMENNYEGFLYPYVDKKLCTNCGLCLQVCPVINEKLCYHQECYGVKNKNETDRLLSSSGGVFISFAKYVLNNHGYVCGVVNDKGKIKHIISNNIKDIKKMMGSKYAQSDINTCFSEIKNLLTNNLVLFVGTPCQVNGLISFLGDKINNLITIDFICHGVPSPLVLEKYQIQINQKILNFRSKNDGWHNYSLIKKSFDGNTIIIHYNEDYYMKGFLRDLYLRKSCYNCIAKRDGSRSDITIGDYWGIENINKDFDDNKGVSVIIINNSQGKKIFENCKNDFEIIDANLSDIGKNNPNIFNSPPISMKRKDFFDNLGNHDIINNIKEGLDENNN